MRKDAEPTMGQADSEPGQSWIGFAILLFLTRARAEALVVQIPLTSLYGEVHLRVVQAPSWQPATPPTTVQTVPMAPLQVFDQR